MPNEQAGTGSCGVMFGYIGVTDVRLMAVKYDGFGGDRQARSLRHAENALDQLAGQMPIERAPAARLRA